MKLQLRMSKKACKEWIMVAVGEGMECTRSLQVLEQPGLRWSWQYVWLNWRQRLEEQ